MSHLGCVSVEMLEVLLGGSANNHGAYTEFTNMYTNLPTTYRPEFLESTSVGL